MSLKRGTHTTLIELARPICETIKKIPGIEGISPGYIVNGTARSNTQRVKITEGDGCILLTFRSVRSVQEVRVYSNDHQSHKLAISKLIRNQKIAICFAEADKKRGRKNSRDNCRKSEGEHR